MAMFTLVIGLITFLAVLKIFSISNSMDTLNKRVKDFTEYYYKLNDYKLKQDELKKQS